ncbi:MAG: DNA polymerase/3'-5' exonuclease PolX [Ardenticatenaceae bacterium]|nr:DNA polymerase/3'-5' exonuclease PolX [Ardenticatenaceae bacterium]
MKNASIAKIFYDVANLLQIRGDNIHRVLSYRRAAETIDELSQPLQDIRQEGDLEKLPGIGKTLAEKIVEMLDTGELSFYNRLAAELPVTLLDLLNIEGVGPKKVKLFYDELQITTLEELAEAAREGKLRELPKMGAKSEEKILRGIDQLQRQQTGRHLLGDALPLAERILGELKQLDGVQKAAVGGSVRRRKETIGDIDLLIATDKPEETIDYFCNLEIAEEVVAKGPTKARIQLANGLGVDLRVLPAENWGTLLSYFTGSQAHNVRLREMARKKGLSLNEYSFTDLDSGAETLCPDEQSIYQTLDLPYIPPVLREDRGEIEAAQQNDLPDLIQKSDIVADLHMHTTWSDGQCSIREMARAAVDRGLRCICITDHSRSLGIANGLSIERLKEQAAEIKEVRKEVEGQLLLLHGTEMEIKADGSLDYPDDVLAGLDLVIASLHVSLNQPRRQITERLLKAIHNPHVDMIAHPTGRLLGRRPGADLDMEQVFQAAASTNTILEINASPQRLDLNDIHIRRAAELGIPLSINTDAHAIDHLDLIDYGVAAAQRGWLTAGQVINCGPLTQLEEFQNGH